MAKKSWSIVEHFAILYHFIIVHSTPTCALPSNKGLLPDVYTVWGGSTWMVVIEADHFLRFRPYLTTDSTDHLITTVYDSHLSNPSKIYLQWMQAVVKLHEQL